VKDKRRSFVALGFCGLLLSCGGTGIPRDAVVAWRLADGRVCADAAVVKVIIELDGGLKPGTSATGGCSAFDEKNRIAVPGVVPGSKLRARALSSDDAVLYRGVSVAPDPIPTILELPMYFTGGS
jgi:hypothetical protein